MKVKELIEKLKNFDQDLIVVVDGYETGYDEAKQISTLKLIKSPKSKAWYDGEYQEFDQKPISWLQDHVNAVYIPRSS